MSQVAATMGMTTEQLAAGSKEFDLLKQAAKDAGASTAFSATEAAEALNYLALAGYDTQTAADALPAVLNLAVAGGLDLTYASDLVTDAMSALGIEASKENLTKFGDQMAKTASKANTSVGQLGEAITEPTKYESESGQVRNGNLIFTILPIQGAVNHYYPKS